MHTITHTCHFSQQHNTAKTIASRYCRETIKLQGRVVRKPVNVNTGLKVNRGNKVSCVKVLSIAYVLCSLRLLMLKTEGQKI